MSFYKTLDNIPIQIIGALDFKGKTDLVHRYHKVFVNGTETIPRGIESPIDAKCR